MPSATGAKVLSLFDQADRVFEGWRDPSTGVRVLRLSRRGDREDSEVWQTVYHQCRCFLDGGRRVLLRTAGGHWWPCQGGRSSTLLDLATGEWTNPFPPGWNPIEVLDRTGIALLRSHDGQDESALWDLRTEQFLTRLAADGWRYGGMAGLADDRRAVVSHFRGHPHNKPVDSRLFLLTPGEPPRLIFEAPGFYCNHIQGCPTDPDLFAYDRWPAPRRDVEQVIHVASLDTTFHEPARIDARAGRPGCMMGARDHYLWMPDGKRIVSYFNPTAVPDPTPTMGQDASFGPNFSHFRFPWVLSALDWQTGEDWSAPYPEGRWGCHMAVTPDSRHIVSAGGPDFDWLYAVEIGKLCSGWTEHRICAYPRTVSKGRNQEPFAFPFVLPDGSGVLFNAGWPGPEHGVFLAEWPAALNH